MSQLHTQDASPESLGAARARCSPASAALRSAVRGFALFMHVSGLNAVRRRLSKALLGPRLIVLAYHRVNDFASDTSRYTVSPAQLDAQLAHIRKAYRVISFAQALQMRAEPQRAGDAAIITFDDGYRDNYTCAAPILRKHGLGACFFLPADCIVSAADQGEAQAAPDHLARMTSEQAKALYDMGFELGAHTRSHPYLLQLPPDAAREEIVGSRQELEQRLGVAIPYFAYPGGKKGVHYSAELARTAAEVFEVCCTTTRGRNSIRTMDTLEVRRICVQSWWSLFHFARELEGTFDLLGRLPALWQ